MRKVLLSSLIVFGIVIAATVVWFMMADADGAPSTATRQVVDATGESVTIPVHPQRVVFLNVSNLDLYDAAGGRDAIVGKPTSDSMAPELAEALAAVPSVGIIHRPNLETILSLHPDLVVGINVPFHNQIRQTLAQNGIPLYINSLDSLEDSLRTLEFFGELTGHEQEAAQKAADIKNRTDAVMANAGGKESPRALILFSSPDSNNMATAASFSGDMLKRLHGINIADEAGSHEPFVPLSMEYVLRQDPQVIFIISMGQRPDEAERFRSSMADSDSWSQVQAVRQGKVYTLPTALFTVNPGSRIADAMEYMADRLYGGGTL